MKKKVVAVLMGGRSSEREVSLVSGSAVARAINRDEYDIELVHITQEGRWEFTNKLFDQDHLVQSIGDALRAETHTFKSYSDLRNISEILSGVDLVFPVLHGPFGEDGTIQGFLDTAGLPYVGGSVFFHSLCMDKPTLKALLNHHNIPTPAFKTIDQRVWVEDQTKREQDLFDVLGLPLFVKPASLGSSVGISKVSSVEELRRALTIAFRYGQRVIIEEAIQGREIECSVMGNAHPVSSQVLGEILPCNEFYDYEAKYVKESTLLVPAPNLPEELAGEIRDLAIRAFRVADGSGYARVDFLVGQNGPMVNELNTVPGFTKISMFPRLFLAQGMSFEEIVNRLISLAWERFSGRSSA